jgi:hypothetical protein
MAPKIFRIVRRIIIFAMICVLGDMLWKNHTTPHYETPAAKTAGSATPTSVQSLANPAQPLKNSTQPLVNSEKK